MRKVKSFLQSEKSIDLENIEEVSETTAFVRPTPKQSSFISASSSNSSKFAAEAEPPQDLSETVTRGRDFSQLVKESPDDVIHILRVHAVTKIRKFHTNDPRLLAAFQNKKMVTYAFNDLKIAGFEGTWKSILGSEGQNNAADDGWHETMTIAIYRVNIKDAETGEADDAVWDFPCVRAVIDFKWTHWARRYLIVEFHLYLGWLLCFVGFMTIYIEKSLDKGFHRMDKKDKSFAILAYVLDVGSLLFMCPFLVIEYKSLCYYRRKWLRMWNILDSLAYILQFMVSFSHFTDLGFTSNFFVSILVVHCTIIFIKLQYFARLLDPGASYVETLKTVVYNVRYFLLFIALSMISAALCLAAFYKREIDQKKDDEDFVERFKDFSSLPRTIVAAYSIFLGNFESEYIFDTENTFMKGAFFLFFQLFLSVAFLNLLIAVMAESYSTAVSTQSITYHRWKAQIIHELELSLPKMFYPKFKSYVHFAVCEKQKRVHYELSSFGSNESTKAFENEMRNEFKALRNIVENLEHKVDQHLLKNE